MGARLPLVRVMGRFQQLPTGDYVPVVAGGTGANDAAGARDALGITGALSSKAPISQPVLLGPVTVSPTDVSAVSPSLIVNRELGNTSQLDIPQAVNLSFTDKSKAARLSAQLFRLTYTRDISATGAPTAFDALVVLSPSVNGSAAFPLRGMVLEGPNVASGATLQSWNALRVQAPTGTGAVTSKIALMVEPNAGNSLFGSNSDNGQDTVQVAGALSATTEIIVRGTTGEPKLRINGNTGTNRYVRFDTVNSQRWQFGVSSAAESGSNSGSNFYINRFDDSGLSLGNTMTVDRVSGDIALWGKVQTTGPFKPASFTLATLPSAALFNGYQIEVTNAAGGSKTCKSNGSVWQILNTTTTVS